LKASVTAAPDRISVSRFLTLVFFLLTTVSFFWLLDSQRDADGVLRESPFLVNLGWIFVVLGILVVAGAILYKNKKKK
jgi:hypothetical protein